jgi:fatty-acyl-CoA synthase
VYDWLHQWAELEPDRPAVEEVGGSTRTYGQLDERAVRLAAVFREGWGLREGDRLALLCQNRVEVLEAFFAAAKARVTLIPLNWRLAPSELAGILGDAEPTALAYDATYAEVATQLIDDLSLRYGVALDEPAGNHRSWADDVERASTWTTSDVRLTDVPLVLYTSGTTGGPKGVKIPWRQVLFNAVNTTLAADLRPDDRTLATLPLFHTGGLHALTTPTLFRGGQVLLTPSFDAERACDLLRSGRATTTIAVPTMYEMMVHAGALAPGGEVPRILMCGGAPLPDALLEELHAAGWPLRQGYGLTEVGPNCFTLSPLTGPDRVGTVGHPAFHSQVKLVDEHGRDVPDGTPGELWIRGPHVTAGYVNRPGAVDAEGWFHTGDVLVRNQRGAFAVVGRRKDMYISGGENVYPPEVENVLDQHPAVRTVAVVGVPDPKWGQVGMACVVLEPSVTVPNPDQLAAWTRDRLARYKVPKHWRFLTELPLNSTGKVQKQALLPLIDTPEDST